MNLSPVIIEKNVSTKEINKYFDSTTYSDVRSDLIQAIGLVGNQKIGVASLPDVQDNLKVSQMWAEIPSQDALSPNV